MSSLNNTTILNKSSYVKSSSNVWWEYMETNRLGLEWTINATNHHYLAGSLRGDNCISVDTFQADGDIILSAGWGDGFAVRRLENDGTLTVLYDDLYPMDSYSNYNNLAVDKINHKAYVSNYVYDGIMVYDYSDCYGGTDSVIKDGEINPSPDECGYSYMNGTWIVGDYLYLMPDETSTSLCRRYNVSTLSQDDLPITNLLTSGRYGEIWYDEDNNRVYIMTRSDGGIWVVTNPDKSSTDPTNPAKCYSLNLTTLGLTNDIYTPTVAPLDSNPNHIWVAGYYGRYVKIDITDVLAETSTTPTILDKNDNWYNKTLSYSPFILNSFSSGRKHPFHGSDLILIRPDRDHNVYYGWFDQENKLPVTNGFAYYMDDTGSNRYRYNSNTSLRYGYAPFPILAESANATKYWLLTGYSGAHGYQFRTFSESTNGLELHTSGNIVFGDFQLDNNQRIREIKILNLSNNVYEPSGCTFSVEVSNNSGSTWENYDWVNEPNHIFVSSGNIAQVKFILQGSGGTKCPYILSLDSTKMMVNVSDNYEPVGFNKVNSFKIKGS